MNKIVGQVEIRPLEDTDLKSIYNLKLKEGDVLELQKMSDILVRDYMMWHVAYNKDITNVLVYKGKIFGMIGITDEGTLFFVTTKLNKLLSFMVAKYFKVILNLLLEERNLNECFVYADADYDVSQRWAKRNGFITQKVININDNDFEVMKYVKS